MKIGFLTTATFGLFKELAGIRRIMDVMRLHHFSGTVGSGARANTNAIELTSTE